VRSAGSWAAAAVAGKAGQSRAVEWRMRISRAEAEQRKEGKWRDRPNTTEPSTGRAELANTTPTPKPTYTRLTTYRPTGQHTPLLSSLTQQQTVSLPALLCSAEQLSGC